MIVLRQMQEYTKRIGINNTTISTTNTNKKTIKNTQIQIEYLLWLFKLYIQIKTSVLLSLYV